MYTNQFLYGTPQQAQTMGPTWVQGEAGARGYLVAPNSSVVLLDSERQYMYIKTADAAGMPTLKAYEYREAPLDTPVMTKNNSDCITRADYEDLVAKYEELSAKVEEAQKQNAKMAKIRKAVADDE